MPVLEGVIVALLTPVDADGKVDHGALRQLVERLVSRGVAGVSPLGSTGEGDSLGLEQRLQRRAQSGLLSLQLRFQGHGRRSKRRNKSNLCDGFP